jgi:hypothetical protein
MAKVTRKPRFETPTANNKRANAVSQSEAAALFPGHKTKRKLIGGH